MAEPVRLLMVVAEAEGGSLTASWSGGPELELERAESLDEALEKCDKQEIDVVLLALDLPGADGLAAVRGLCGLANPPAVIALSDSPADPRAVEALKLGAFSCLGRPLPPEALLEIARRASRQRLLQQENEALRRLASRPTNLGPIIAESVAMKRVVAQMEQVAGSTASVLIQGETGAGKGLVARLIHGASPRRSQPFMHVNCAALQETLLESELFGHERGAFTGAVAAKPGLFEVADRGTLFLDEIAETDPAMQAKLLQVLDSGEFRRVGGTRLRRSDVRILAATQRRLKVEVREGRFRQDLFFRLNVVALTVPALRERRDDIPALVEHYLGRYRAPGRPPKKIARRAVALLMEYHWPGNVRELANVLESACLLAPGETILPEDLPPSLQPVTSFESRAIEVPLPLIELEKLHIARALEYTDGNKAAAARLLGIDVKTLGRKVESYNIEL
jgi:DNA-binding NtrC family response regulator